MKIIIRKKAFPVIFPAVFAAAVLFQSMDTAIAAETNALDAPAASVRAWREMRFGMFIHWGVYSIPGRGEWAQWNEQIPVEEYAKLADEFKPTKFNADEWAATAKAAGMKYMVLTARHHDGFSLWDSAASYRGFTSMQSAAHRDFVAEYTKACRAAGLKVGLYYSPLDWRFPGFFFPGIYRSSAEAMKQQTYAQVRELLTNYGRIDVLWWDGGGDDWLGFGGIEWTGKWQSRDGGWPQTKHYGGKPLWDGDKLNALAKELQPSIIRNNRANVPNREWDGDFHTPEGQIGKFDRSRPWETCYTIAGSWGYRPGAKPHSLKECIQLLVRVVGADGNLLLNVGPRPDGQIEPDQVARLKEIGNWLAKAGESIYGTRGGPFKPHDNYVSTCKGNSIYVHVLAWDGNTVHLPALPVKISSQTVLTGGTVALSQTDKDITLDVPNHDHQEADTIIRLDLTSPAFDIPAIE
jgi:alpha-L-fucosidase